MAVKTCKKDCTPDIKEKFMSEAGMFLHPSRNIHPSNREIHVCILLGMVKPRWISSDQGKRGFRMDQNFPDISYYEVAQLKLRQLPHCKAFWCSHCNTCNWHASVTFTVLAVSLFKGAMYCIICFFSIIEHQGRCR